MMAEWCRIYGIIYPGIVWVRMYVCVCVRVIEDRHRDIENAVISPLLVLHLRFTMPYLRIDKSRDKMKNNASHPSFYRVKSC